MKLFDKLHFAVSVTCKKELQERVASKGIRGALYGVNMSDASNSGDDSKQEKSASRDCVLLSIGERSVYAEYYSRDLVGTESADCFTIDIFLGKHSKWVEPVTTQLQQELSKMIKKDAVEIHILRNWEAEEEDEQVRLPASIITRIMQWVPVKQQALKVETEGIELHGTFAEFEELWCFIARTRA